MADAPAPPAEPAIRSLAKLALVAGLAWLAWKILSFLWRTSRIVLGVVLYAFCFLMFWTGIIGALVESKPEYAAIAVLVFLPGSWLAIWIGGWRPRSQPPETAPS